MYVCLCHKVTDKDIRRACQRGVDSMDSLQETLKVATCCGRCKDCALRVLHESINDASSDRFYCPPQMAQA